MATFPATRNATRRSYGHLVERLLPHQALPPARRMQLAQALLSAADVEIHAAALAAMRELAAHGHFQELPDIDRRGPVFRATGSNDRFILVRPGQQASRPQPGLQETLAEPPARAQTGVFPPPLSANFALPEARLDTPEFDTLPSQDAPVRQSPQQSAVAEPKAAESRAASLELTATPVLAGEVASQGESQGIENLVALLDLAEIQPRLSSLAQRLYQVLDEIERVLPDSTVRLCCLESSQAENLENGTIQVLKPNELEAVPHFRAALESGRVQFATSAPEDADPQAGELAAAVPLQLSGQPWGVLQVSWAAPPYSSLQRTAMLLEPVGRLLEVAIRNQTTLETLVFLDPLTGAYNRAFYERQVALEIERAHRTNRKFALLVLDVDDFKQVNDRFGHRAGDQVLTQLVDAIRKRMRKIDLLFRYGGEEFVLLLPGGEAEDAKRTGERLRQLVSEIRFDVEGAPADLGVTVSVGAAVYPDHARTQTGIFKVADEAMYRAKRQGKNCVALA